MSQLKEREQKILSYMKEEIRTKGYPPTVREICAALGIKSTSTAHKDIESLVKQGYLVKDPSKSTGAYGRRPGFRPVKTMEPVRKTAYPS